MSAPGLRLLHQSEASIQVTWPQSSNHRPRPPSSLSQPPPSSHPSLEPPEAGALFETLRPGWEVWRCEYEDGGYCPADNVISARSIPEGITPSHHHHLTVWWPLMAASLSLLVLVVTLRTGSQQRIDWCSLMSSSSKISVIVFILSFN